MSTRTLHYGGSFNPVHWGHLRCAEAVRNALGFGAVVLVPSYRSPSKSSTSQTATPADRVRMCKLAAVVRQNFDVDDWETTRPSPSYTLHTVRALKRRGASEVNWLIGADQLMALPRWYEPQALLAEATLWVMRRPGVAIDWDTLPEWTRALRQNVVDAPLIDISSTDIRARVERGDSIDEMVPEPVRRYIVENGLYVRAIP